jgi:hypothetical protein
MEEKHWEPVYDANGQLEAEMLRGLLEAQGITVFLSQEGAGRAFGFTVGPMGLVQVLVPASQAEQAFEIVQNYVSSLETTDSMSEDDDAEEEGRETG